MQDKSKKPTLTEMSLQHFIAFAICIVFPGLVTSMASATWLSFERSAEAVRCTARTCVFFIVPFKVQVIEEVNEIGFRERAARTERQRKFGRTTNETVHVDGEGFLQIHGAGDKLVEVSVSPASIEGVVDRANEFLHSSDTDSATFFTIANWKFGAIMGGVLTSFTALYVVSYSLGLVKLVVVATMSLFRRHPKRGESSSAVEWTRMSLKTKFKCPGKSMTATSDRAWQVPKQPWIMRMTWSELLFAHWPVDANSLAALLPKGLKLDTYDGQAWIGVVPFLMSDVAPRFCPPIPKLSRFLELNVRTYVTLDGKPGVWFFSLDAANRIAVRVARATFNLPYMDAKMSLAKDESEVVHYRSERTHRGEPPAKFEASYGTIGEAFHADPGTLEHWLTARYCLYSADRKGRLYRGEIDHDPWLLAPAHWTVKQNTICEPLGINLTGEPHLLFARPIKVRAWMATRCD